MIDMLQAMIDILKRINTFLNEHLYLCAILPLMVVCVAVSTIKIIDNKVYLADPIAGEGHTIAYSVYSSAHGKAYYNVCVFYQIGENCYCNSLKISKDDFQNKLAYPLTIPIRISSSNPNIISYY